MIARRLALLTIVAALAAAAALATLATTGPRSTTDWGAARAVVLESDDWGLCGFVPDSASVAETPPAILAGRFPAAYRGSTLEDAADVDAMASLLGAVRGRDGGVAVLQPNYIMGWQEAVVEPGGKAPRLVSGTLPDLPAHYARPGLWRAVAGAVAAGVWYPEYHGLWHYDPEARERALAASPAAAEAALRGVLVFPGSEKAFELDARRPLTVRSRELDRGIAAFTSLFGRRPDSVIAPDYRWGADSERLWASRGILAVQAKREQRQPRYRGRFGRLRKALERGWTRRFDGRLVHLERNVLFEPLQTERPGHGASAAARAIRDRWRRGEPAVVGTHRVNYVRIARPEAVVGRRALRELLRRLEGKALFLTDVELARLDRDGTCWRRDGERIILRNLGRSRRPICLPDGRCIFLPGYTLRVEIPALPTPEAGSRED